MDPGGCWSRVRIVGPAPQVRWGAGSFGFDRYVGIFGGTTMRGYASTEIGVLWVEEREGQAPETSPQKRRMRWNVVLPAAVTPRPLRSSPCRQFPLAKVPLVRPVTVRGKETEEVRQLRTPRHKNPPRPRASSQERPHSALVLSSWEVRRPKAPVAGASDRPKSAVLPSACELDCSGFPPSHK
jgi:hypothetical protein